MDGVMDVVHARQICIGAGYFWIQKQGRTGVSVGLANATRLNAGEVVAPKYAAVMDHSKYRALKSLLLSLNITLTFINGCGWLI